MELITYIPIGVIHSHHSEMKKTPIQPVYAENIKGLVEIYPEFTQGLKDLDGFSHIYLIYSFHKEKNVKLIVKPYLEDVERGVFATRSPFRPNKIGISVVKLIKIENNFLHIENVDILEGTPLLDIKPYTTKFDLFDVLKSGWQDDINNDTANIRGKRDYKDNHS